MSVERRRLLDKNMEIWTQSLELDDIIFPLYARNVLNENVIDIIKNEPTVALQRYQFIKQLKMRGNTAFCHFYHSLLSTNQKHLAHLLESALSNEDMEKFGFQAGHSYHLHSCMTLREVDENAANSEQRSTILPGNSCSGENYKKPVCLSPTQAALEKNREYYKSFEIIKTREPAGILHDLLVDYVDALTDFSSFNADLVYPNFTSPRGLALIINNRYFTSMPERIGTDVDEINLNNLLGQLHYKVSVYRNLNAKEMLITIQNFAKLSDHKYVDSCVVCVLTHGEQGELFGVDEFAISVLEFVSCLNARNCPALAHKPKLFFLQACRGQQYDHGFGDDYDKTDGYLDRWLARVTSKSQSNSFSEQRTKSPIEADILISYATTPGYVSWRNSLKGSWFIQSICEVFAKYAKSTDVLSMLTLVNKQVADAFESSTGSYKQIPDHSSRLRKAFYFFPGATKSFF